MYCLIKRLNFKNIIFFSIFISVFLSFITEAYAKDIKFEINVDSTSIPIGSSTRMNLTFNNTQNIPAPELPQVDGLDIRYVGPSTMMSFVNGKMSSSITHIYTLIPLKEGSCHIGPFTFKYKGDSYTSGEIKINVTSAGQTTQYQRGLPSGGQSQISQTQKDSIDDYVFLTLETDKNEIYVNELVSLQIKFYISRFNVRDIQYPEISHEGFSLEDFDKPKQYQQVINGVRYEVLEFNTKYFATRPGELVIGPAELECSLLSRSKSRRRRTSSLFDDFFGDSFFDDFFGNYERHPIKVKTPKINIRVLGLPEEGKPEGFNGALGNFKFSITAEPREITVGDPITLKMTVKGKGNLNTVSSPQLSSNEGFKVYDPGVKQEGNVKTFEQIIMPTTEKVTKIPVITFSYFDMDRKEYGSLEKGPIPIVVKKGEAQESLKIIGMPGTTKTVFHEKLGRDIIYIKQSISSMRRKGSDLYKNKIYLGVHGIPILVLISLFVYVRRKERLQTDLRYARRLHAPKKARKGIQNAEQYLKHGNVSEFYDTVFKTLQEYLGNKYHLVSVGITIAVVDNVLAKMNIDKEKLDIVRGIFNECDIARYAPTEFGREQMEKTLNSLKTVIDYLERFKG